MHAEIEPGREQEQRRVQEEEDREEAPYHEERL